MSRNVHNYEGFYIFKFHGRILVTDRIYTRILKINLCKIFGFFWEVWDNIVLKLEFGERCARTGLSQNCPSGDCCVAHVIKFCVP